MIKTELDEWIYMLKHSAIRADFKSKNIDKAGEKLTLLKMSPEEHRAYEKYVMDMVVQRDVIETARNEGRNEGAEAKALQIAKKMHSQGMDLKTIATLTGLSSDVISRYAQEG